MESHFFVTDSLTPFEYVPIPMCLATIVFSNGADNKSLVILLPQSQSNLVQLFNNKNKKRHKIKK